MENQIQLSLSLVEFELLQEALYDAMRLHASPAPCCIKTRYDYRSLLTNISIQKRDNAKFSFIDKSGALHLSR